MKWNYRNAKRYGGALAFAVILALGWRYPYLAYCMFLNVAAGLFDAVRHGGRHGCGNFCPRGAFYSLLPDTGRKVPAGLLKRKTSILVMIVMVAGLAVWLRPTTIRSVGMLLYIMIVITTAAELGGKVSGEHGIGYAKKPYLAAVSGVAEKRLTAGLKAVFDPRNILNPGKIIADAD